LICTNIQVKLNTTIGHIQLDTDTIRHKPYDKNKYTQTYMTQASIQIKLEANNWKHVIKHTYKTTHTQTHIHTRAHTIRHSNLVHKFRHTYLDSQNFTRTFRHMNPKRN
jgi:hypothetical protein